MLRNYGLGTFPDRQTDGEKGHGQNTRKANFQDGWLLPHSPELRYITASLKQRPGSLCLSHQ